MKTRELKLFEQGHSAAKSGPEPRSCLLLARGSFYQAPSSRRPLSLTEDMAVLGEAHGSDPQETVEWVVAFGALSVLQGLP